jgi:hypothetical protein
VEVLRASVPLARREEWIAQHAPHLDVVVSHPRFVETGLDWRPTVAARLPPVPVHRRLWARHPAGADMSSSVNEVARARGRSRSNWPRAAILSL